ncbi:MAG: hypothetical protein GF401_16745 [Chitinivibrionales bacterium]|nr:hypothetical protein [Chitinivibrionales bacterium]
MDILRLSADSRFLECSSNMILVNWFDEKAINVTKGYRSCKADTDVLKCDIGTGDIPGGTTDKHAESGDFWVSSVDEINPEFRCFVDNRELWRSYWADVFEGRPAVKPECVVTRAVTPACLNGQVPVAIARDGSGRIVITAGAAGAISLFAVSGKAIVTGKNIAKGASVCITAAESAGILLVQFRNSDRAAVTKLCFEKMR